MAYIKQTWENNPPSTATPISASRLSHLETQYDEAMSDIAGAHSQNVSGITSLPVTANHLYELTATSEATVTLTGTEGAQVAIRWSGVSGTVEGQAVSAGQTWVAVRWASGWVLYEVGGSGGGGGGSTGWVELPVPAETLGTALIQWFVRRDGAIVHLKIKVQGTPAGASLGLIPDGYKMTTGQFPPNDDMIFPLVRGGTTSTVNMLRVQYGNQAAILAQNTVGGACMVSWPTDDPWPT